MILDSSIGKKKPNFFFCFYICNQQQSIWRNKSVIFNADCKSLEREKKNKKEIERQ
jgi:hypothetical protein